MDCESRCLAQRVAQGHARSFLRAFFVNGRSQLRRSLTQGNIFGGMLMGIGTNIFIIGLTSLS